MGNTHPPRTSAWLGPRRRHRLRGAFILVLITITLLGLYATRDALYDAYTLAALPFRWGHHANRFYISQERDGFDLTFGNYSSDQLSAEDQGYQDKVPAVLHHISLGGGGSSGLAKTRDRWMEVRQSCLDIHRGWEARMWTDEAADAFVEAEYPELWDMWKYGYRFPIQRIDALRYMVLYRYGGKMKPPCFLKSSEAPKTI